MSTPLAVLTVPSPKPLHPPVRAAVRPSALTERAARAFAPQACVLGYAVYTRGGVSVAKLADERAELVVRGKRSRNVVVAAGATALHVACTCAPTSLPLAPCRHVWAALLELDRQGAFPAVRATRGALRVEVAAAEAAREAPPAPAAEPTRTKPKKNGATTKGETTAAPTPAARPNKRKKMAAAASKRGRARAA